MAIVKISDLVELTTPAGVDEIPIVDISEPLAADKTKKMTVANLLSIVGSAIYRRQGGSATDWSARGTTTYTPTSPVLQAGSVAFAWTSASSVTVNVTFPVAYAYPPIVIASLTLTSTFGGTSLVIQVYSVTNMGFTAKIENQNTNTIDERFHWLAIGE